MQWVERVTVWYLVICLLQCFLNEAQDETQVGITQQAVNSKERNLYIIFKDYVLTNLQPFINLLKCNVRLFGSKNGFSNFFDFLYLAWLSRYKNTIENNFSHQWRKTSGCRARNVYVWWPESEFPWWQKKTDEMTTKVLSSHLRINAAKPNTIFIPLLLLLTCNYWSTKRRKRWVIKEIRISRSVCLLLACRIFVGLLLRNSNTNNSIIFLFFRSHNSKI